MYVPKSSHSVQHCGADLPLRSALQQPRNCLETKCWRMIDAVTPRISLTVFICVFGTITLSSLELLVSLCGFSVWETVPLNVLELFHIRDTSGCLTGLVNKPVFIPLVLLASHPVFPALTVPHSCLKLSYSPSLCLSFFNFICLHVNFLYWGVFGPHLISFPEEGILRDLSSQSGTLHSYPVLGFSLKLHYWIVFCLNVDST